MPLDIISHTPSSEIYLVLEDDRVKSSVHDLDSGTMIYFSNSRTRLTDGMADPTYPGMEIEEVEVVPDGDITVFTCSIKGNLGGKVERRLANGLRETEPIQEWDTYEDAWLTTNKDKFRKGQRDGDYVCIEVSRTHKTKFGTWMELHAKFAGLKSGISKSSREVVSNGQVISGDQLRVNLEQGWTNYRKGIASLPKIVVTDTEYALTPAATQSVPSIKTPPGAPGVRVLAFSGSATRQVWPPGWGYTCGYTQPFGLHVPLYVNRHIYEWNTKFLPA